VTIVTKPKIGLKQFLSDSAAELINAVKEAFQAKISCIKPSLARAPKVEPKPTAEPSCPQQERMQWPRPPNASTPSALLHRGNAGARSGAHCLAARVPQHRRCAAHAGKIVNEIADQLCICNKTSSTHKVSLMAKMNFDNEADPVRYAMQHGLCD